MYNIRNPIDLGVNVSGTTQALWKSLTNLYDRSSEIAKLHAEEKLQSLRFHDGDDFSTHIAQLRLLWQKVNAMGGSISDASFHTIILGSLPASWDSIVATLYTTTSSVDALIQLDAHWSWISSRDRKGFNSLTSPTTLQTSASRCIVCENKNCRRPRHLIKDCYWVERGKQGQFPPGFGKRWQQQQQQQSGQRMDSGNVNPGSYQAWQQQQQPPRSYNVTTDSVSQMVTYLICD